jgi:hypothetical protein
MKPGSFLQVLLLAPIISFAQNGTIKVKKTGIDSVYCLTFSLFEKCVGSNKDSAIKWVKLCGFNEGKLKRDVYMNNCPPVDLPEKKKKKFTCRYFVTGGFDLVVSYDRKDNVYCMLVITSAPKALGETLSNGSLAEGYQLTTNSKSSKWYRFTEKDRRLTTLATDKGVWYFQLIDRSLE